MLRETTFYIGAVLLWILSGGIVAALVWSGAGWIFFETYGGAGLGFILGGFLWWAARASRRSRQALLQWDADPSAKPPIK
jgi:hypothetical protein